MDNLEHRLDCRDHLRCNGFNVRFIEEVRFWQKQDLLMAHVTLPYSPFFLCSSFSALDASFSARSRSFFSAFRCSFVRSWASRIAFSLSLFPTSIATSGASGCIFDACKGGKGLVARVAGVDIDTNGGSGDCLPRSAPRWVHSPDSGIAPVGRT